MACVRLSARLQVCSALPGKAKLAAITDKLAFAADGLLRSRRSWSGRQPPGTRILSMV